VAQGGQAIGQEWAVGGVVGVRRQIYIEKSDDRLLEERSKTTGLSVSELVRRAVHECYGSGRKLSWDEFFSTKIPIDSRGEDGWAYDPVFDDDYVDEALREADRRAE
jgi:hypothetical protein